MNWSRILGGSNLDDQIKKAFLKEVLLGFCDWKDKKAKPRWERGILDKENPEEGQRSQSV